MLGYYMVIRSVVNVAVLKGQLIVVIHLLC